jgi:hypothetical protein
MTLAAGLNVSFRARYSYLAIARGEVPTVENDLAPWYLSDNLRKVRRSTP